MKKYPILIVVVSTIWTITASLNAQTQCTTNSTQIPAEVFPITDFGFWAPQCDELNLWKEIGINTLYGQHAQELNPFFGNNGGMKGFPDFGEIASVRINNVDHGILGSRLGSEAIELRFFLASNFDHLTDNGTTTSIAPRSSFGYDLMSNWTTRTGSPFFSGVGANKTYTFEWLVPHFSLGHYNMLAGLKGGYGSDNLNQNNRSLNGGNANVYCDFIYRIPSQTLNWVSLHGTEKIFGVKYDLICQDVDVDGITPLFDANRNPIHTASPITYIPNPATSLTDAEDPIHFLDFDDLHPTWTNPDGTSRKEAEDIKLFPNPKFQPNSTLHSHNYAVKRTVIPLTLNLSRNPNIYGGKSFRVLGISNCTITSEDMTDIFVRGIRIRTELAEEVLTGALDQALRTICRNKRTALINLKSNGVSSWDNTLYFVAGGEPDVPTFSLYSYVDNLCNNTIRKHIFPFLANNGPRPDWYRAIYEQQTGKTPGPISMEDGGRFGLPKGYDIYNGPNLVVPAKDNAFPIPADGIDLALRNDDGFKGANADWFYITGGTNATPPLTGMVGLRVYDYAYYTAVMQAHLEEDWDGHTDGFLRPTTFVKCAQAINPPWAAGTVKGYGKYFGHINFLTSFTDSWVHKQVDNTSANCEGPKTNATTRAAKEKLADKVLNMMRAQLNLPTSATKPDEYPSLHPGWYGSGLRMDYFSSNNQDFRSLLGDAGPAPYDQQENPALYMGYRPVIRTELRAQFWNGICYGMQGLVINTTGKDWGGNIGWCQSPNFPYWTDLNNNNFSINDLNYVISDHTYTDFNSQCFLGSCDHPAVPLPQSYNEQQNSTSVWDSHIVWIRAHKLGEIQEYLIFFPIPIFKANNTLLVSQQDINTYVAANLNQYNGKIAADPNTTWIINAADNFWQFASTAPSSGSFMSEVGNGCTVSQEAATRAEFAPQTFPTYDDGIKGGNIAKSGDVYWENKKIFYRSMYHYPNQWIQPQMYLPTFYGFKEKDIAGRRIVADLNPIANRLSLLHWVAGVNYAELMRSGSSDKVWTDFLKFPILTSNSVSGNWNPDIKSIKFKRLGAPWVLRKDPGTGNIDDDGPLYPDHGHATAEDANTEKFYEFGLFKNPDTDPTLTSELFVSIANKRTWPMFTKDFGGTVGNKMTNIEGEALDNNPSYAPMGGVDARRLSFKINPAVFTYGNTSTFFDITDLRTNREKILIATDTFCRDFEPGEGTLLRIAPAYSFPMGKTSDMGMAYNNGHRIANPTGPNSIVGNYSVDHVMTWEKNNIIQFNETWNSVPLLIDLVALFNLGDIPGNYDLPDAAVRPSNVKAMNPSIAAKGDTVAIIYNLEPTSVHRIDGKLSRDVIVAIGVIHQVTFFLPPILDFTMLGTASFTVIDNDVIPDNPGPNHRGQPNQLVTPSITPMNDGFFCSWSKSDNNGGNLPNPHYIQPAWVHLVSNGNGGFNLTTHMLQPIQSEIIGVAGAVSSVFPSVISRDEANIPGIEDAGIERLHLAWEEQFDASVGNNGLPVSQIVYTRFDHALGTNTFTMGPCPGGGQVMERVSKFAPTCEHHHPNIALTNAFLSDGSVGRGEPRVAWEMVIQRTECIDGGPVWAKDVYVATRERYPNWLGGIPCNNWSSFTNFHPKNNNLPLPLILTGPATTLGNSGFMDNGVLFQDNATQTVETAHLIRHPSNPQLPWVKKQLLERGQYPSESELYKPNPNGLTDCYTFREIDKVGDNPPLYSARITTNPLRDKPSANNIVHHFIAKPRDENECDITLHFVIGPPNITCCSNPDGYWPCNCFYKDTAHWEYFDIAASRPHYYSDTSYSSGYYWNPTEDSIRTDNFHVDTSEYIQIARILSLDDSVKLVSLLTDSTKYIEFQLLLKDSATHQTLQSIEDIKISGSNAAIASSLLGDPALRPVLNDPCHLNDRMVPPPPPPPNEFLGYSRERLISKKVIASPPSGKAYLTLAIRKSYNFPLVLAQTQIIQDQLEIHPIVFDSTNSYKKGNPPNAQQSMASNITLSIHPNPFQTKTDIELDAPKDIPLNITVFDVLGRSVNSLYNDLSSKDHYSFTLDSRLLSPGTYFVRVQAGGEVVSQKIELVK